MFEEQYSNYVFQLFTDRRCASAPSPSRQLWFIKGTIVAIGDSSRSHRNLEIHLNSASFITTPLPNKKKGEKKTSTIESSQHKTAAISSQSNIMRKVLSIFFLSSFTRLSLHYTTSATAADH